MAVGVTQLTLRLPQEAPAERGGPDFSRGEHSYRVERSAPTEIGATRQLQGNCVTPRLMADERTSDAIEPGIVCLFPIPQPLFKVGVGVRGLGDGRRGSGRQPRRSLTWPRTAQV